MLAIIGSGWLLGLAALAIVVLVVWGLAASTVTIALTVTHKETNESTGIATAVTAFDVTGDSIQTFTPTVNAATSDVAVDVAFTISRLKSLLIISDQTVTLEVNSSSAPSDTITLTANRPWFWYSGSGITCPITGTAGAVTKFYFSNAGASAATVRVRACVDATA